LGYIYTQKRQFPEAFVATVTKFAQKEKKKRKENAGGREPKG
jgi:hypothetical protein